MQYNKQWTRKGDFTNFLAYEWCKIKKKKFSLHISAWVIAHSENPFNIIDGTRHCSSNFFFCSPLKIFCTCTYDLLAAMKSSFQSQVLEKYCGTVFTYIFFHFLTVADGNASSHLYIFLEFKKRKKNGLNK